MKLGRTLSWFSGPILALVLLWFSFRGVRSDELVGLVRRADPLLLVLTVASGPMLLLVRALRWRTLLWPIRARVSLIETFSATSIGYLAGLLPGRIGEVLRPALLSRRIQIPFGPTLATVGVERILLDLLTVLSLGALALILPASFTGIDLVHGPDWLPRFRQIGAAVFAIALMALFGVHLMGRHRVFLTARLERAAESARGRVTPAVIRWISTLLPGFAATATFRGMAKIVGLSVLIWVITGAGVHAGIVACGVDLPPGAMLVLLPILVAGISIPTPGNTGTFHLAMKLGLVSFYGVDEAVALGAGLVVHFFNWVPFVVLGALSVALGGMKTGNDVGRRVREVTPVGHAEESGQAEDSSAGRFTASGSDAGSVLAESDNAE